MRVGSELMQRMRAVHGRGTMETAGVEGGRRRQREGWVLVIEVVMMR